MAISSIGQPLPIGPLIRDTGPLGNAALGTALNTSPLGTALNASPLATPLGASLENGPLGAPLGVGQLPPLGSTQELSSDSQSLFTQTLSDLAQSPAPTPLGQSTSINPSIFDSENPFLSPTNSVPTNSFASPANSFASSNQSGIRLYENFQQGATSRNSTFINAFV